MEKTENEQNRVSVVMPVYCHTEDHEKYLKEALISIAGQTTPAGELVIVDDNSPREIDHIIESIDGLPPLVHLKTTCNMGHIVARNMGIKESANPLIAFCDHDDLWLPEKLELQTAALNEGPETAMVFCDMEVFGEHKARLQIDQSLIPPHPDFKWFINHGNYTISASAVMVRKDAMEEIGLFDTRYSTCDDFDAWLKISRTHTIVHIPEVLARYRLHNRNVNYGVDRLNDNILLTSLLWEYMKSAPIATRLALFPRLLRKLAGRLYFIIKRHRSF